MFALVVHGGAGDCRELSEQQIAARKLAMAKAIESGYAILLQGRTSIESVETSIRVMEDSGAFNAGRGASCNRDGVAELDSSMMDGRTLAAGAVASVKHIANPIRLARLVMEHTPHVLLSGEGAEQFAKSRGMDLVPSDYFLRAGEWKRQGAPLPRLDARGHGTVGAVALDRTGNLAAGTSTGGTPGRMPGRVGDSPLIGAGTYANNETCAISCTGVGEYFIRNVVAHDISARMKYLGVSLEDAANEIVMTRLPSQGGMGGLIGLDRSGNMAASFNSNGMIRGFARADGRICIKVWNE